DLAMKTVEVLVTEGRVQVSTPMASAEADHALATVVIPILRAGQRAVITRDGSAPPRVEAVSAAVIARVPIWRPRQLEFNDVPLAQVVAEFNSDNAVKMVVDDPMLASLPIGTSLRSDNVEGFVRILEVDFGVKAERRSDGVIVL